MSSFKVYLFLLSVMVINFSFHEESRFGFVDAARPISVQQQHNSKFSSSIKYLKMFETLGMVCKCCDGADFGQGIKQDLCTTSWNGSCSNLQCFPWKFQ
ncbi:unnamed protein product [Withania somnifera]